MAVSGSNYVRNVAKDIREGKDARDALNQRAQEVVTYLKEEVMNNPSGDVRI